MASAGTEHGHDTPTGDEVLVGPTWMREHWQDRRLRIVEVDVSGAAYGSGHLEGAVLWNVYRDLKDAQYRTVDSPAIQRLFERSGIESDSVVVFYGYAPAMGFWLMKLHGHRDVRILNLGRQGAAAAGLPWTDAATAPTATRYFLPAEEAAIRADRRRISEAIHDPTGLLADVRTDLEFRGERFWPSGGSEPGGRAGHVPSAVHVPVEAILDEKGSFRGVSEIRDLFAALDLPKAKEVITYCTIGARACTAWFALTYLMGYQQVRVYDGSWAEWGLLATTPVEAAVSTQPAAVAAGR